MSQHVRPRWVELEGAVNVRDVGGLPTVDGHATRPGVLLRADNLQGLTRGDVRELVEVRGVRTVIDLRSTGELHLEGPGPLRETGVVHHHLSLIPEFDDEPDEDEVERAVERAVPARRQVRGQTSPTDMTGHYIGYVTDGGANVGRALRLLAEPDTGPAVVHCAAGKDRTGVVVALALSLAGVPRHLVVDDYVRSAERIEGVLARLQASPTYAGQLEQVTADLITPEAGSMERFLDHVDQQYGGPHGLAMSLGVGEEVVARLCTRLVGTSALAR